MHKHKTLPMWVLLAHVINDDTLYVICHWHYKPSRAEQKAMIALFHTNTREKIVYRLAQIPNPKKG